MDRRVGIGAVVGALAGALAVAALGGESGANAQARTDRRFSECYALQVTGVVGEGVGLRGSSAPLVPTPIPSGWSVVGTVSPGAPGVAICR